MRSVKENLSFRFYSLSKSWAVDETHQYIDSGTLAPILDGFMDAIAPTIRRRLGEEIGDGAVIR